MMFPWPVLAATFFPFADEAGVEVAVGLGFDVG